MKGALVSISSLALAFAGTTSAFLALPPHQNHRGYLSAIKSASTPPMSPSTTLWAASGEGDAAKSAGKRKRRVRKDQPQRSVRDEKRAGAEAAAIKPSPPVTPALSPDEVAARAEAEASQKKRVDDVIKRDFDRILLQEEFVDGSEMVVEEEEDEEDEEPIVQAPRDPKDRRGDFGNLNKKFRFDPTFDLPIKSEGTMDLEDVKVLEPGAKPDSSVLLPKNLVEVGKKVKQKEIKAKKEKASKRLFGFEPEVMAKDLEPIENYDITAGVLGDSRDVMGVGLPFLQSSHTIWLLVALLCAFVEFPGFPLTTLPNEVRAFLKTGLVVIYAINTALAVDAIKLAKNRDQSVPFWVFKTFMLGALAHNELHLIRERKKGQI